MNIEFPKGQKIATMNQPLNRHPKISNFVLYSLLFGILSIFIVAPPIEAAIIPTGNVEPGGTWTSSTDGYVGRTSDGSLLVNAGSQLQSSLGYIANNSGVSGIATVTGAGSKWTNSGPLYVGYNGNGTLRIEAGGQVSNSTGYLGYASGSSGTAMVTGAGSKWTNSSLYVGYGGNGTLTVADGGEVATQTLYASLGSLLGDGTITATKGAVLDADFRFDAAHVAQATVAFGSGGTLTVNAAGGVLGAGYKASGSLTIAEGVAISSGNGYLGYDSGSSGTATITGAGSKWANSGGSFVGYIGSGAIRIEAGGLVSNSTGYLGYASGSSGAATVTGAGSTWINSSDLYVGYGGNGTLTVADGGEVTAKSLYASLGSLLGNGTITATKGAVLDADFRFDAAQGTQATLIFGSGGTLNVSVAGGNLGAGYKGSGSLTIAEGVAITSYYGYLGYYSASSGTATVTGAGSKWTNTYDFYVGKSGNGMLCIEAGGQVSNSRGYVGYASGSSGAATVTGAGSKWTNSSDLYVGLDGAGTLTVADGGEVSAQTLYASLGSLLGNGTITATKGAVLDADLRFDAAHGAQATVAFGSGGTLTVTAAGGNLGVGYKGSGSLAVAQGVAITSSDSYLGFFTGSSGTATVIAAGSKWTNNILYVGLHGSGTLCIEAGGQVTSSSGYLGNRSGSSGTAAVTGAGSMWTTISSLSVGGSGVGTLRIEAGGQVNSSYGYLGNFPGPSSTATVTGTGSMWNNSSSLSVGYFGAGTLRVEAGGQVNSGYGYLGNYSDSSGTATVTGTGSKWTNSKEFYVGRIGVGTLRVEAGGQVSNSAGYLGYESSTLSTAMVTGVGSMWTNNGSLEVDRGTMSIRDGGVVTASSVSVYSISLVTIDVGCGSNLRIGGGTGSITNGGKVRVLAGPQLTAGSTYSPISAGTWSGSGTYQALGGTWNTTTHVFTASQTLTGVSGTPVAVELAQRQRVLVEDTAKNWTVGASFLAKTGTGNTFDFTATAVAGTDLTALSALLEPGQSLVSGWNFIAAGTGYIATDPIYLSLGIPASLNHGNVQLWRQTGGTWSRFTADDLTPVDGYASFTSTGLSTYAVAAFLPSPTWKADADGLWQNASNWTTDNAPGDVNSAAVLGPSITAPRTVTLSAPLTLGLLTFDSAQHYTLAGTDELKLQVNPSYTAEIEVKQSDAHGHTIETPITLASPLKIALAPSSSLTLSGQVQNPTGQTLALTGGGTLTVTQGLATTGTINVQSGTLITPSLTADTLTIGTASTSSPSAVPEPSSLFIFFAAIACLAVCFLRARRTIK